MKRLALLAVLLAIWLCSPAHAQFNGCSSFCGTSSSAIADAPGFNNAQGSGSGSTLACTYTPVTTGTQNVAYTGATPSASGGVPAYTFSETGSLPSGLTISSSTGVISGTPSVSGTFTGIQVKVTDTASTVVNCGASFTLVIAAPPPTVSFLGTSNTNSGVGTTTITWTVNLGVSSANRRNIVVVIAAMGNAAITGATLGGVNCDVQVSLGTVGNNETIFIASAPVGVAGGITSGNLVLTYASANFSGFRAFPYLVDNSRLSSPTPVTGFNASAASAPTNSVSAAVLSGGFVIASGYPFGGSGTSVSFSASSPTLTVDDVVTSAYIDGSANGAGAGTASVTMSGMGTGATSALAIAAWR